MSMDVIKDYLVSLGFSVDMNQFNRANKAINDLGKTIESQTAGMSKNFAIASTAIVGALVSVATATAGVIERVATLDMEYQKLGLHMWVSTQQAKEMKLALDAMGQSAEDVAWIPELRAQYNALVNQGREMQTPGDASGQLQNMRQIGFEFQRMKLEASFALEWVAYYLIKYLSGPLKSIKDTLKDFNDKITQTMPQWTEKIARWLTMIINLGKAGIRFVMDLTDSAMRFFDQLPKGVKMFIAALAGVGALLLMSPIGLFITALGAILLLLEDFYGYVDGRKSSKTMAPIWKQLLKWLDDYRKWSEETLPTFSDNIGILITRLEDLNSNQLKLMYDTLKSIFTIIGQSLEKNGVLKSFQEMFLDIGNAVNSLALGLINVMKKMDLLPQNTQFKGFWHWFGDELSMELKRIAAFGKAIAAIVDMIGLVLQGKYKEAAARGASIFPNLLSGIAGAGDKAGGNGSGASNKEMMGLAQIVSNKTGISADLIYGQWYHESGGFSSQLAKENNNFGGLKNPDGSYMSFNAPGDFANYFAKYIKLYAEDGVMSATTPEEYATALKHGGYYEDSVSNYAAGVRNGMPSGSVSDAADMYAGYRDNAASTYTPTTTYSGSSNSSTFTTGDINFNVSSDEMQIAKTVEVNMQDANGKVIARQTRELSGVYA